jgi:hypothetical protein
MPVCCRWSEARQRQTESHIFGNELGVVPSCTRPPSAPQIRAPQDCLLYPPQGRTLDPGKPGSYLFPPDAKPRRTGFNYEFRQKIRDCITPSFEGGEDGPPQSRRVDRNNINPLAPPVDRMVLSTKKLYTQFDGGANTAYEPMPRPAFDPSVYPNQRRSATPTGGLRKTPVPGARSEGSNFNEARPVVSRSAKRMIRPPSQVAGTRDPILGIIRPTSVAR